MDIVERARLQYVVNIGQVSKADQRLLNAAVKRGELFKYRGYWNTLSPHYGLGPLKSIWVHPDALVARVLAA